MADKDSKPVLIREVWGYNLEYEFMLIRTVIDQYSYVSMDTEFPGSVYQLPVVVASKDSKPRFPKPSDQYRVLKSNVDALNLIQVGLTFLDSDGNLPDLGTEYCYIWEFNFKDFDVERDLHVLESIDLLRRQGIDVEKNRAYGVDSFQFARLMVKSRILGNDSVSWVTFHSAYDFGYLVKILTSSILPDRLEEFMGILRLFFGNKVYDVKYMMKFCKNLYGGLERVAQTLGLDRAVGKCHQAGSDSLLTWRALQRLGMFTL